MDEDDDFVRQSTPSQTRAAGVGIDIHCVASTESRGSLPNRTGSSITTPSAFHQVQFSADGTSIVALTEDRRLATFVLPPELLEPSDEPRCISTFSATRCPSPIQCYAIHPYYELQHPSTTLFLAASRDSPITLYNALYPDFVHSTYSLVNPATEAFIAPSSLSFCPDGHQFVAGAEGTISVFDLERIGSKPLRRRHISVTGSQQDKSTEIVKALSVEPNSEYLAVGSLGRTVALYEHAGRGECITAFQLDRDDYRGTGITSLKWSADGHYLCIAERSSDCVNVYDVRQMGENVSSLVGRKANTKQVLGMDIVSNENGCALWAGGIDGAVRMWSNPGLTEGIQPPDVEIDVHDGSVTSSIWHPTGAVMATSSSHDRSFQKFDEGTSASSDDFSDDSSDSEVGIIDVGSQQHQLRMPIHTPPSKTVTTNGCMRIWAPKAPSEPARGR